MSGGPDERGDSLLAAAFLAALPPGVRDAGVLIDPPDADGAFFRVPAAAADVGDLTVTDDGDELTVCVGRVSHRHFEVYCQPDPTPAARRVAAAGAAAEWVAEVLDGRVGFRVEYAAGRCLGGSDWPADRGGGRPPRAADEWHDFTWSGRTATHRRPPGGSNAGGKPDGEVDDVGAGENEEGPPDAAFPASIRWGRWGAVATLGGYMIVGTLAKVLDRAFGLGIGPNVRGGAPAWAWPFLALIAAPGVAGLLLAFYTVARYPYFSLAGADGPAEVRTGRGIFKALGAVVALLAVPFALLAGNNPADPAAPWLAYLAAEFLFVGWLLACYRRERHPTVATWLAVTFGLAIPLGPLYLPSIWLGSRRLRRALRGRAAVD